MFTDLKDWKRVAFPHFMSFQDASLKAAEYQLLMDPKRKSFDFRVHMCSWHLLATWVLGAYQRLSLLLLV